MTTTQRHKYQHPTSEDVTYAYIDHDGIAYDAILTPLPCDIQSDNEDGTIDRYLWETSVVVSVISPASAATALLVRVREPIPTYSGKHGAAYEAIVRYLIDR